jgi:hypothetical protein
VLVLRNSKITDAGIDKIFGMQRLKAALPNTRIEAGQFEMVRR